MNLELLISTMNRSELKFFDQMCQNLTNPPNAVIVNQSKEGIKLTSSDKSKTIFNSNELGLSKSRNKALQCASGKIGVIADDDVIYLKGFEEIIFDYHQKYSDYSALIFKIKTFDNEDFRIYPNQESDIKEIKQGMGVCSIEMTLKLDHFKKNNILFDERFGLGSKYQAGEEWVFISDAIKKGLKIKFIPEYIVAHKKGSSGTEYKKERIIALGAVFKRVYGIKGLIRLSIFYIFLTAEYFTYHNRFRFLYFMLKGFIKT